MTLLTSQLLSAPSIWEQHRADGLRTSLRILSVFNSAAIHRPQVGAEEWTIAVVKGTDGGHCPRWRHLCVLAGLLIGFEGRDKVSTSLRRELEHATVKAVNLTLHEGEAANELAGNSVAVMLTQVFDHLHDVEKLDLDHDLLLPILYQPPLFSKEGLYSGYFLSSIDADIVQRSSSKFDWSSKSSTYVQCQDTAIGPLMSSLGSLSRVTAFSVENVRNVDLLSKMVNELSTFSRSLCVQWRQNKLSEIDITEEKTFLSDETLRSTLPLLWRVLKSSMFAIVITLRALLGRVLGDPRMPVAGGRPSTPCIVGRSLTNLAPFIAIQTLHILRNLYFISSRLGSNSFSQYTFVYLTAIDILSQYPLQAKAFLQDIRPTSADRIPQHPLDRCYDLYFLNTAEHFTTILAPELNEELLIGAATPYLGLGSDQRLLEIFEAAHSVMLAVFSAFGEASGLFESHLHPYVEILFQVFPENLSARQFRLAIKTLIRITSGNEPSVILELVRYRLEKAPSDQSMTLVMTLIDGVAYLPMDELKDWLPIIFQESRNHTLEMQFWQAISSREMDTGRAALCLEWWTMAREQPSNMTKDPSPLH